MTSLLDWVGKVEKAELQDPELLKEQVIAAMREIYDPELPVNIYDLGLIYAIDCGPEGMVNIDMTLTSPGCPVAQSFPGMVENGIKSKVDGVTAVHVELVWSPPWSSDLLTDEVKLDLGLL